MGVPDIEAEHIALVLDNASSRAEELPDEHIHQQLAYLEGAVLQRPRSPFLDEMRLLSAVFLDGLEP